MPKFDTILLDLDGTIVDAFTTIHRAYVNTLPKFGRPAPTMAEVRRAVGGGLEQAMRNFLPEELIPAAAKEHVDFSTRILLEDVVLFPGTLELIQQERAAGATFAVFTNKRGEHARLICTHLGVTPYLAGVFGAKDTPWFKPQPEFAAHVIKALNANPARTLLIGDSPFDVQAAKAGGFAACWCVTTGTHTAEQLMAAGADEVFPDLLALAAKLRA